MTDVPCKLIDRVVYITATFPSFWRIDPEVWFIQVDAFFEISNITEDKDKFLVLASNLECDILPFMADIIKNPPATNKYEAIKERIIKTFTKSVEIQVREVIKDQLHCVAQPSHLLQAMLIATHGRNSEAAVKAAFLERVTKKYRHHFNDDQDIEEMGAVADKLCDSADPFLRRFWDYGVNDEADYKEEEDGKSKKENDKSTKEEDDKSKKEEDDKPKEE